jgi:hypothetical protein
MTRKFRTLALVSGLIAAGTAAQAQGDAGCGIRLDRVWAGAPEITATAETGCDLAGHVTARLSFVNHAGEILDETSYPTDQVMSLAWVDADFPMESALDDWLAALSYADTTANLPYYQDDSEFPFLPAEGMSREAYDNLRASAAPMVCYVQGMESQRCLALVDGALIEVGLQTFPG